jgi:hypothetical protein
VNTASRWAKAAYNGPKEKAEKFRADYSERRQNPTGRSAPTPPDLASQKAAQAKAVHAGLNNTMPMPTPTAEAATPAAEPATPTAEAATPSPEAGTGRHRAPETAAAFDGIAPAGSINGPTTGPVQTPTGNSRWEIQSQSAEVIQNQQGGMIVNQWENGKSPATPGADPAMAPASGAVTTKPGTQQATPGQQGEAAASHNKHRKPDSPEL